MSLWNKAVLACILDALALQAGPVMAEAQHPANTEAQTQQQTEDKRKTLMADATAALAETQGALRLLDDAVSARRRWQHRSAPRASSTSSWRVTRA